MVLQQLEKVPIWGEASPGEIITVEFGEQIKTCETDLDGHWEISLDPLLASSEPTMLSIRGGDDIIVLRDILVGEVWLCTGQSNMQWTVSQSDDADNEINQADYPLIRLFNVSREIAFGRQEGMLAQWEACTPTTIPSFSAVAYYFGRALFKDFGVPIGLINSSYGGSQAEAWTPRGYLAASDDLQPCIDREKIWEAERPQVQKEFEEMIQEWEQAAETARQKGESVPRRPRVPDALRDYRIAGSIYENMIDPLAPFAIQGVLWYQGESNENRAEQYQILLPVMIQSWRDQWHQGDFPFGIIQLPNFRDPSDEPQDLAWSHIREAQRMVYETVNHTGLIVTIDVGEHDDIHPTNKQDVGLRCAQWAQSAVYHQPVLPGGPEFRSVRIEDGRAILTFDHVGEGLATRDGQKPQEFAIATKPGEWVWAQAEIINKNQIAVWHPFIFSPKSIRYAFNNNPVNPNLTNDSGIPASPFRTDIWPGPTAGER